METIAMNERPLGITLLAGVCVAIGAFFLLTGVVYVVAPRLLEAQGYGADAGLVRRLMGLAFVGVVAAILGYTARGLWTMRQSSRSYVIALACAGPAWLLGKLDGIRNGSISLVEIVAILAASAVVMAYMMSPTVRGAFKRPNPDGRG